VFGSRTTLADQLPEHDDDWSTPTLQERRAIIYAAQQELSALTELLDILES